MNAVIIIVGQNRVEGEIMVMTETGMTMIPLPSTMMVDVLTMVLGGEVAHMIVKTGIDKLLLLTMVEAAVTRASTEEEMALMVADMGEMAGMMRVIRRTGVEDIAGEEGDKIMTLKQSGHFLTCYRNETTKKGMQKISRVKEPQHPHNLQISIDGHCPFE